MRKPFSFTFLSYFLSFHFPRLGKTWAFARSWFETSTFNIRVFENERLLGPQGRSHLGPTKKTKPTSQALINLISGTHPTKTCLSKRSMPIVPKWKNKARKRPKLPNVSVWCAVKVNKHLKRKQTGPKPLSVTSHHWLGLGLCSNSSPVNATPNTHFLIFLSFYSLFPTLFLPTKQELPSIRLFFSLASEHLNPK